MLWAGQDNTLFYKNSYSLLCDDTVKHYFNEIWLHVFNSVGFFQKQMNFSGGR